ncbi:hypothetical protein BpHYR1_009726 [Brachionus plicatilis]|uniref:Uncharacterized protein n=1 Tax=Brachionus plicatilis TaxID=10195 RepID=A0A3M7R3U6_BRAPC|nr:hypothetical protein BpHYR1_009726 [Brachionus plicatilis]
MLPSLLKIQSPKLALFDLILYFILRSFSSVQIKSSMVMAQNILNLIGKRDMFSFVKLTSNEQNKFMKNLICFSRSSKLFMRTRHEIKNKNLLKWKIEILGIKIQRSI